MTARGRPKPPTNATGLLGIPVPLQLVGPLYQILHEVERKAEVDMRAKRNSECRVRDSARCARVSRKRRWALPMRTILLALIVMLVAIGAAPSQASADAGRLGFVQDDGSLKVGGRTVRLHGIYIPPTRRTCRTFLLPPRCGSRAALALDFRIQGFVYCDTVGRNADGSISAVCRVDGEASRLGSREDLAAYLLSQGWAVALPDAPFEYMTLERIARVHNRGVWGFQVDSIHR